MLIHINFRKLWRTVEEDFPESDIVATVYSGGISYTLDDFEKIEGLIADFEEYKAEEGLLVSECFWLMMRFTNENINM